MSDECRVTGRTSGGIDSGQGDRAAQGSSDLMGDSSLIAHRSSLSTRFGLLGLGERGQALAAAVNELPGVALIAGTAGDEADGSGRGTWWGYATAEELIAAPDVDAVLVALQDAGRASGYAREALERR